MKKIVDLHIHTLSSDGADTPNKIIKEVEKISNIEPDVEPIISFTDHDSMGAYDNITIETFVKIIKGCEFTTRLGDTEIHILGYGLTLNDPELKDYFKKLRETKLERLKIYKKVLEKNNLFIPDFFKNIIENNYGISASSIIYYLQERTLDFDKYALYKEMMNSAKGVARPFKEVDEIINLIHNSGGLAFLAHPLNYNLQKDKLDDLLTNLKDLGLDGMELYHSDVNSKCLPFLKNRVNQHHFLVSGGSDFHGKDYTNRKLGYFNSVYLLPSTKISPQLLDSKYYYKKSPEPTKE